ncbi:hypothetical protein DL546_008274 [Coniochaeta pulveracea]|uniref:Major facilitator superfamily (MFS) profile domain-containing protein n=1 Tax=Coniochaeta pulveracea TaxID=177199 RepID=A0A420YLX0_9PEZI|nr:hypothetical protein DL546_008274 [Coniochaeta pulveracea]
MEVAQKPADAAPGEDKTPIRTSGETTEDVQAVTSSAQPASFAHRLYEWKPKPTRYDPENPPKFTLGLNILFAITTTFTVATLYYNQAILYRIADTFDVSFEKASSIATLMQAGYATGLLFICPLGDIFRRRPFILYLIVVTGLLWLGLCLTHSFTTFSALSYLVGVTTVTPQLMHPLVGDLAPPHRRASSIALVSSGLSLGMLIGRLLGGVMANYTSWRNVYWFGLATQFVISAALYVFLPDYPSKNPEGINYFRILGSIFYILATEPVLIQAALVSFLISAVFTSFWTTLSFLLSSPPYNYSSQTIGLFGLIGIFFIVTAPLYSRAILDKIVPLVSILIGFVIELAGTVVGTFVGTHNVAGPVIQAVCMDLGAGAANIANRARCYSIRPDARNRVNTAYMLAAFFGQLTGTAVGNRLYAQGGWVASGSCSIGFLGACIVVCLARGPRETGWIGWGGGWKITRDDLPPKNADSPGPTELEMALDEAAGVQDDNSATGNPHPLESEKLKV